MTDGFRYRAFISYSHADEKWARWLHRSLETYRVPKRLVGRETEFGVVTERVARVFRDRDELGTATSLGEVLTRALTESACLIAICSPAAAKSRWVNEEILTYKRMGRENRIFCLVVAGEPGASSNPATADAECFPPALIFKLGPDGNLSEVRGEPIAADVRPGKDGKTDARLKLLAGILGVGFDELKGREAHRRQKRMMMLAAASVTGMAITSGLAAAAWLARNEAERQRERAEVERETAEQTTRFMVDLFKVSDPSEALGNTITAREILDKGAARIDKELANQPAIQATLMDTMGTVYTSLGLYGPDYPALPLVREAYNKRLKLHGPEHADVASSLNHLGELLTLRSDYDEAETRLRDALAVRRKLFGESSSEVAESLSWLAEVLSNKGQYTEAEPLIREALTIRRTIYTPPHPDIARSIEELGLNYFSRGEYEQAVSFLNQAVAMREKIHGPVHPALAQAIDNLAGALMDLGKVYDAEMLSRRALAMKRQLYGDVHPETAAGLNNLAYVMELRGNLDAAERAYREALTVNRKLLGASHPMIAVQLNNIAFVEYAKGERSAAIAQLRESLDMYRRELGPDHPQVGASAASLAYWLIEARQYDEAEQLLEESLRIRRTALGPEHPQVAGTLTVKASLMLATGKYQEARELAAEARRILGLSMGDDAWQIAAAMNVEGAAYAKLGDYPQAERLLLDSRAGLEQSPIPDLAAKGRQRLAELYRAWGKPDEASKYSDRG